MKCEWEQAVIEATRSGEWPPSLRAHLEECALCLQTERMVDLLQEAAARTLRSADPPPAGLVWRHAQMRQREREFERATRQPFLIVSACAAVYSVVFLLWGIFELAQPVHRVLEIIPGLTQNLAIAGVGFSAVLAIAGSCVLTIESKG